MAERYLRRVLDILREDIPAGTPIVGMEPSCLAVFKDELTSILPHDDDARRLQRCAYHFSEFFEHFDVEVPRLARQALLWGHCHHKATGGMTPERKLLERVGLDVQEATGGCCGLAGSWGFEQGKYDTRCSAASRDCCRLCARQRRTRSSSRTASPARPNSSRPASDAAPCMSRRSSSSPVSAGPIGWTAEAPEQACAEDRPAAPTAVKARRIAGVAVLGALMSGAIVATVRLSDR